MNLIETLRAESVRHEMTKIDFWEQRRAVFRAQLPNSPELKPAHVVGLGDHLSDAFQLQNLMNNRGQGALSGGGSVWTALVNYYFNLCLAGTDGIAVSGRFIPSGAKQALKVTHSSSSSTKLNSDIDIVVITVPGISGVDVTPRRNVMKAFQALFEKQFDESSFIVVQTKTNWNDNSQVPMLWNLIYRLARLGKIPENGVAVGYGGFHIRALKGFGYAFVTVPTQKNLEKTYTPNSTAVVRVRSLSGGAYWGRPSRQGIMSSLAAFFDHAYNLTQHCFPSPNSIGRGYRNAVVNKSDAIDLAAFNLSH